MDADVAVIGAGPSGAVCAYWLAVSGLRTVLLERDRFPRDKPCGDALTPLALRELHAMGLAPELERFHTTVGLRFRAGAREIEHEWRRHPQLFGHGKVARRRDLDELVARRAEAAGVELRDGAAVVACERAGIAEWAVDVDGGERLRARAVVLADGATSRLARSMGLERDAAFPLGLAIRGYYESVRHDDPFLEVSLGLPSSRGPIAGYGWVFPVGDGTVNLGVGYLSTFRKADEVNLNEMLAAYVDDCFDRWGLVRPTPCERPKAGRLPMGASISPIDRPGFCAVGDAGALNNPFIGEGIGFAYESGRLAAEVVADVFAGRAPECGAFDRVVAERYGGFLRVGSAFSVAIGWPSVLRAVTTVGLAAGPLMDLVIPLMNRSVLPDSRRPLDLAARVMDGAGRLLPTTALRLAAPRRRRRATPPRTTRSL